MLAEGAAYHDAFACKTVGAVGIVALGHRHLHSGSPKTLDDVTVYGVVEVLLHAFGYARAYVVDCGERFDSGVHHAVDVAERAGQFLGYGFAHEWD